MNSENNYLDDLNFQIDNENDNISIKSLINSIPLNNLNDYYDIETSLFKKKCENLNLKFYWETESLNFQKEIPHPYYKLFLILFKEISLYIEEIERLNKQLREKDKIKLFSIQNNLKENNDKNSTKIDNEIVKKENKQLKLNLNTSINSQSNYINSSILKNSDYINVNINSKNKSNSYNNELKISNKSKKNFSISQSMNNEMNSDLIERCINQYDDELYNLDELEQILLKQKKLINIKKNFSKNSTHKYTIKPF
jgi:hypothetical protein